LSGSCQSDLIQHVALPSIAVLIVVGMIIGVWIASGTVQTLIHYGLASAVTGVNVFDHIKNTMATTLLAMPIALTIYLAAGFLFIEPGHTSFGAVNTITKGLAARFELGWVPLLPALLAVTLALQHPSDQFAQRQVRPRWH